MTSIFDTSWEYPTMHVWCKFGISRQNLLSSHRMDRPNFLVFWVKMVKMTFKIEVNDLHFQNQPRVPHDAWLMQIWWFQLKSVTSYRPDKVKFTGRRTGRRRNGQAHATAIPLRPKRSRGKNAHMFFCFIFRSLWIHSWEAFAHIHQRWSTSMRV